MYKIKPENLGFWALIILVATVIGSLTVGYKFFESCLPFDSDKSFDGAKAFFQTSNEQSKSTWQQEQDFEELANYQLLTDAADYFDGSETNQVSRAQLRKMIKCYEKYQTTMPKIYSDLEEYNHRLTLYATIALVISVFIAWAAWRAGYGQATESQDSKALNKSASGVKSSVKKIKQKK